MRAYEILNENTAEQLMVTISDYVAARVAEGAETIGVSELVVALRKMGFNATEDGIMSVAAESPFVHSVENGELQVGEKPGLADAGNNADDQVDQMASSAVDIG